MFGCCGDRHAYLLHIKNKSRLLLLSFHFFVSIFMFMFMVFVLYFVELIKDTKHFAKISHID